VNDERSLSWGPTAVNPHLVLTGNGRIHLHAAHALALTFAGFDSRLSGPPIVVASSARDVAGRAMARRPRYLSRAFGSACANSEESKAKPSSSSGTRQSGQLQLQLPPSGKRSSWLRRATVRVPAVGGPRHIERTLARVMNRRTETGQVNIEVVLNPEQ
jgi:hypothetical protein